MKAYANGRQAYRDRPIARLLQRGLAALEPDYMRLNQKGDSPFDGFVIQDAGWGGGPALDGKTLFARPARSRGSSVASGRTCRATAAPFRVSVASVVKWSQRWRASGSAAAKQMGWWRPLRLQSEREWLLARIAEKPDLTLRAVVAELAERGTPASCGAVWRFFKHAGITFKKLCTPTSRIAPTSLAAGPSGRRVRVGLTPTRLVFIDETWAKTNMTRRHGRCSRGARLVAKVPQGCWRTLTFLAALRHDCIAAPCVIDGPINGVSFRAYIEQFFVPTLNSGDVVVMDNLGSHKSNAVRGLIRAAGAKLFYLPRYSPDLNPI